MKNSHTSTNCLSWNCCDEKLKACIERSDYVNEVRNRLKEKKKTNNFNDNKL